MRYVTKSCHRARYIIHLYYMYLVVEAGFYGNVVECSHVDLVFWVSYQAEQVGILLLYEICTLRQSHVLAHLYMVLGKGANI